MIAQIQKKKKIVEFRPLKRGESPMDFMAYAEEKHGRAKFVSGTPTEEHSWRVAELILSTAKATAAGKRVFVFVNNSRYDLASAIEVLDRDPSKLFHVNKDGHGRFHISLFPGRNPPRRSPKKTKKDGS